MGEYVTAKDSQADRAKRDLKEGVREMKQQRQKRGGWVPGSDFKCPLEAGMPRAWSSPDCTFGR